MSGLAGAGALLAGALWLALGKRRGLQHWMRRPGRTIRMPAPHLARVEKTIQYEGGPTGEVIRRIDETLRRLASRLTTAGQPLPSLVGVDATLDHLTIRLSRPFALPEPWQPMDADDMLWRLASDTPTGAVGELVADSPPPWPQLTCLGADRSGWRLVNLESLGVVTLTGDPTYSADLARYLAVELSVVPWARDVVIDCVGCCEDVRGLAPARIRHHNTSDVLAERVRDATDVADRLQATGQTNLETARASFAADECWESYLVIAGIADAGLSTLTALVNERPERTATTVVIADPGADPVGVEVNLTSAGRVLIPALGLDLITNGLTEAEARAAVAVLGTAPVDADDPVVEPDDPMPPMDQADPGSWTQWSDEAGALRPEHTHPRGGTADAGSVLPAADDDYLGAAATTAEDLAVLAPVVSTGVRDQVEASDPSLDADLADWWADSCDRPRIQVLGPIRVRLPRHGEPSKATSRVPFCTEIVAYLSTRPKGVTKEQFAEAFDIHAEHVRKDASMVRGWLGTNPATGEPWLPRAPQTPEANQSGRFLYYINGLLSDADLFRRLRIRGEARGADGMDDLLAALKLVKGRPFDQVRTFGGIWLADTRIDEHLLCGIVDIAHIVTVHALHAGNLEQAAQATAAALVAAPEESTPQLDLAAITTAQGDPDKAAAMVRAVLGCRDGDGYPLNTPERTARILRARDLLRPRRRAS